MILNRFKFNELLLPRTLTYPSEKIDGWKMNFLFRLALFLGDMLIFGGVLMAAVFIVPGFRPP